MPIRELDWVQLRNLTGDQEELNGMGGAWLNFGSFDMDSVLQHGTPLLASGANAFDEVQGAEKPRDRLLRQRRHPRPVS